MPLSTKDFDYYKDVIKEDEQEANLGMRDLNLPDDVVAMYEGRVGASIEENQTIKDYNENYILISINTTAPSLFYQMPRPLIRSKRDELRYSAEVMNSLATYYINDEWKKENQLCILDAYLAYGYGVMKVGYNSRRGKLNNKPSILTGKVETGKEANQNIEDYPEYIKFEKPVFVRQSPKDTFLDASKPFGKGNRVTFTLKRTLKELVDSNLYPLSSNFINYFKNNNTDQRKVKFDKVYEHFCMVDGYCWKLVYVPEWNEELYWGKTTYQRLPYSLLRFNKSPDKLYSVSHGHLAYKAQKELNYLNELWKQHIDKTRRQHLVWEDGLTENGKKALRANEIDGIVTTNKPVTTGIYAPLGAPPMNKDIYGNIENVRQYLKLLLSTTGGRGGETDSGFAYTEKQQAAGDSMRMGGMQDEIRDFVRDQLRMLISNIVKLGSPELTIKLTGKDVKDPVTGDDITGRELQIGGEDGLSLQEEIKGDIEKDYIYDCDITSAARPDYPVIRKQLADGITMVMNLRQALKEKGKDVDVAEMVKDYFNTYDTIPNPDKYIVELSDQEKQDIELSKQMLKESVMKKAAGVDSAQSVPQEESIMAGAESLQI